MRKVLSTIAVVSGLWAEAAWTTRANDLTPKGPDQDGTKPALVRIAGEGLLGSHAFQYLTELSDDVGARVTGTPQAQKAIAWGLAKMRAIGLENVHAEKWPLWRGWTRGTAEAELLWPLRHNLHVDAMGWTGSTPPGGAEGDLVAVNAFHLNEEIKNAGRLKGKIVLCMRKGTRPSGSESLFVQFGEFLRAAQRAGAVAVIGGQAGSKASGLNLTHTGILGFDSDFAIPVLSITAEDQGQLERYLERGITPRARLNVQNTFTTGPVQSANVVGDIRGREDPEQVFVVGAHLDSWDLAEGSTDNGTGSASVLGAAEAIEHSGLKPRRTIRFVLFTGEEQGLDGSFAYIKGHQAEMTNHLGSLVLDEGQGPVIEIQTGGRDDVVAVVEPFSQSLANIRDIKVTDKLDAGTDTLPFSLAGLPGISLAQDSPDYKYTHHSAADALEQVKPEVLTQNATLMALTAFWIADRPERFAAPWPAERTAGMLRARGQYELLKAFHLWPYGDLGKQEQKDGDQ